MAPHTHRQFGLDIARFTAISLVLAAHFVKKLDLLGFWGVELFFALSGFLIGGILRRSFATAQPFTPQRLLNFWSRRWWRTLPNYYLFMLVFLVWHYLTFHQVPDFPFLIKHLWFGQDFLRHDWGWFGVSWSLCIEEWFYLSFPALLYLYSRFNANSNYTFLGAIFTVFIGCLLTRLYLSRHISGSDLRTITVGRLDAIGCGVLMAYLVANYSQLNKLVRPLLNGGVLLILSPVYCFLWGERLVAINPLTLLLVPLGFSLMLPFLARLSRPASSFIAVPIEKLSLWSYSIYLSHIPILFSVYSLMDTFRSSVMMNVVSKLVGLVLCIGISALVFEYVERPLTKKRPKELINKTVYQSAGN